MLISNAYAQAAAAPQGSGIGSLIMMIVMFGILWFLMIRPQMKRAKGHKAMVEALAKGDEVVTQGGIAGRISELGDTYVHLEVADNVTILVQRPSVAMVLPKGTLKAL